MSNTILAILLLFIFLAIKPNRTWTAKILNNTRVKIRNLVFNVLNLICISAARASKKIAVKLKNTTEMEVLLFALRENGVNIAEFVPKNKVIDIEYQSEAEME